MYTKVNLLESVYAKEQEEREKRQKEIKDGPYSL
jgi:hypothetical protein